MTPDLALGTLAIGGLIALWAYAPGVYLYGAVPIAGVLLCVAAVRWWRGRGGEMKGERR